jgi:hypothetical protein
MVHLTIQQYDDDIYVYRKSTAYLLVKRTVNFNGKVRSVFFYEGKKILETTYDIFFFKKYLSIEFQDLPSVLKLERIRGNYILHQGENVLMLKRKYFKNPLFRLYLNDVSQAVVNTKVSGVTEIPTLYDLLFESDRPENFYLLILFLADLAPIMDV